MSFTSTGDQLSDCSDGYQDDSLPDLHRDDSLPDLVLSSLPHIEDLPDINASVTNYDVPTDIEEEYFKNGDQVSTSCSNEGIRVSYADHTKLYIPKIRTDKYRSYLNLTAPDEEDIDENVVQSEFMSCSLSPENQQKQRESWQQELQTLEREIQGMEKQLRSKVNHALLLKRKLGVTAWREFSEDMREGMQKLKDSDVIQRMENSLADLRFAGESLITEAVEIIEKGFDSASEELISTQRKTSEALAKVHRKASQNLQRIGILTPPKEYRKDNQESLLEETPPISS